MSDQPQDLAAERGVLGSMLLDNDIIPEVLPLVKSGDFYQTGHAHIFAAIAEVYQAKEVVELVTLAHNLKQKGLLEEVGGHVYLANLEQFTLSTGAAPELAEIVAEKAVLRRILSAFDAMRRAATEEKPSAEVIEEAHRALFALEGAGERHRARPLSELGEDLLAKIEHSLAHPDDNLGLIETGFPDLDEILGPIGPGKLIIVAARPSVGKSAFIKQVAVNISRKYSQPVHFGSLEMGSDEVYERLIATESEVFGDKLNDPRSFDAQFDDYGRVKKAVAGLTDVQIFIDDDPAVSLAKLIARQRAFQYTHPNCRDYITDYLQIMDLPEYKGNSKTDASLIGQITMGAKQQARRMQSRQWMLAQLLREPVKGKFHRPSLSELKDSGNIEQDADIVIFLYRGVLDDDGRPAQSFIDSREIKNIVVEVAKNRKGKTGVCHLRFNGALQRWGRVDRSNKIDRSEEDGSPI